jgi:hypothetical protein
MLLVVAVLAVCLVPTVVQASIDPYAPLVTFQMAVAQHLFIDGNSTELALMSFHSSSNNWILFFRHNNADESAYDNLSLTVECNGESPVTFDTTDYSDWVDKGVLSIEFPYQQDGYSVTYNTVPLSAKYSKCTVSVDDYGGASYVNNSLPYYSIDVEMIPYLSTFEFIACEDIVTTETSILDELEMIVGMMTDFWQIAWLVYSIFIVIVAVFMIPIFIFILIRWAIYRLSGYKLIERKENKLIVAE